MVDGIVSSARVHRRPLEASPSPATRAAALVGAALLAAALFLACGGDGDQAGGDGGDDAAGDFGDGSGDGDGGDSAPSDDGGQASDGDYACSVPEECVAVSSTCCGCPDFAARADSDYAAACDEVECEEPAGCPQVIATCVDSLCAIVCKPIATTKVCENGFAPDALGCLQDLCRTDPPDPLVACEQDTDCVQVPADCCGCELGGADTAVNVGQVDAHAESLQCRRDPACPGLDVCDADQVPRCFAGGCSLASSDGGGGTDDGGDDGSDGDDGPGESEALCGAPELPPCPAGQVCVLNHQDAGDATHIGVGTCRDA